METAVLGGGHDQNHQIIHAALRAERSFDIKTRLIGTGGRRASIFFIGALVNHQILSVTVENLQKQTPTAVNEAGNPQEFLDKFVNSTETKLKNQVADIVLEVLAGSLCLIVDGYDQAFLLDAKDYPVRSVSEPEDDRVLRGAHDGFVEALVSNAALIRRRVRDPRLTMEVIRIGSKSQTDVCMCYMEGVAKEEHLTKIRSQLKAVNIPGLGMAQESLEECLLRKQHYNPFPKIRYTERPDRASASVMEGKILVLVDNSPLVMVLPTSIFDFVQDTNEYYFPPLVGSYLRWVRGIIFLTTLFLMPVWYMAVSNPSVISEGLEFLKIREPNKVPLLMQLLIVELVIDGLRVASLNTPSSLSNAFGLVGSLILGEFAVGARMLVPEVLLYMAFVSVFTFVQPSFQLGYAFKLFRLLFIILTALFDLWGFLGGVVLMLLLMVTTKTVGGRVYLHPIFPFDGQAVLRLLFRRSIHRDNT